MRTYQNKGSHKLSILNPIHEGRTLYSFFNKVSRAALYFGINLADINARDAYTRGDDATDKPHGNEQGGPTLDGLALEMLHQGKDNHDEGY